MDYKWSTKEKAWIDKLESLLLSKPNGVQMYVIDGGAIFLCKKGVPSNDMLSVIDVDISACCMLPDVRTEDGGEE